MHGILLDFRSVARFDIHTTMDVGLISKVSLLILTRILFLIELPRLSGLRPRTAVKLQRLWTLTFTVARTRHTEMAKPAP